MANIKNKNSEEVPETNSTSQTGTASAQTSDDIAAAERAASEETAAADKATADKAAAAEEKKKKKQDDAAAKAAATDSESALKAIEDNTAQVINADPMVNIFIAKRSKEDNRAEVCINGHWWRPKKGELVSVPHSVALILRESEKVLNENEALKGEFEAFTLTSL